MSAVTEFDNYLTGLCELLSHKDRHERFKEYCRALMLPLERKSVEPMAAHTDARRTRAKHQAMHHFVAKAAWSDEEVLRGVREYVSPSLGTEEACYWIVDDTGFPKKGAESVGVAHQYCGQLGKQENCQVAVSLSLASERGSLPIAFRLYMTEGWIKDGQRRKKTGVPPELEFQTKPEIALDQIRAAKADGVHPGIVLGDSGYGNSSAFRDGVADLNLMYCVGIQGSTTVWKGERKPSPSEMKRKKPVKVEKLAAELPKSAWRTVSWREGSNERLESRFSVLRVNVAHEDKQREEPRGAEWLLIHWPEGAKEPEHIWLCTLPAKTSMKVLVHTAMSRYRIERDYQELKQEFGLADYEGRGWCGFHHHATLAIVSYGFLLEQRLRGINVKKKTLYEQKDLPYPKATRREGAGRTQRHVEDSIATLRHNLATQLVRRNGTCPCCQRHAG
jgi:SRSO17 transposase